MKQKGFTLLEVLIATVIMAIAITGLLSALSTSLGSAARLTDYDRAALLGRQKMEELLITTNAPKNAPFEGGWGPEVAGDLQAGWRAEITPFEMPPARGVGLPYVERVQLEIWWMNGQKRRTLELEGFRRSVLSAQDRTAGVGSGGVR